MFTGIIFNMGAAQRITSRNGGAELWVTVPAGFPRLRDGDSVAVNGVCLTVRESRDSEIAFDVIPETLARSNLGDLTLHETVNLEPSLRAGEPLGGHLVYGHVDTTTRILSKEPEGQGYRLWCETPPTLNAFIVEKGYVALDGVSLTVAVAERGKFAVALIPETLKRTTLGRKAAGLSLNIEVDPVARYVAAQFAERGELR